MDSAHRETYQPLASGRLRQLQRYRLASFRARAGAIILDSVAVLCIVALIHLPMMQLQAAKTASFELTLDFGSLASLAALVLYYGVSQLVWNGSTPGKRVFGIRVVPVAQERMSLALAVQRALAYTVSAAIIGLGFLQFFRHPNRQTLHDRLAETIVVVDEPR